MMSNQSDHIDQFVMMQIATWSEAVTFQGNRLLAFTSSASGTKSRYRSIAEEEFFVVAARRLFRWLNEGKRRKLIASVNFSHLSKLETLVTEVRDMREHSDDYIIRNSGKKQTEFHYSPPPDDKTSLKYSSDATATIILNGNYLIGGRLSVQEIIEATGKLREEFKSLIEKDERFRWIAV